MCHHGLYLTLFLEIFQASPGKRSVDLHPVDEGGNSNETVGLNIFVELVCSGLLENDSVLGLVLDLALRPLLLLLLSTGRSRSLHSSDPSQRN